MKVDDLLVEVRDANYNRVGLITSQYLVGFTCVLRYNAIGTWSLSIPSDHPLQSALTTPGAGIVVTLLGQTLFSGPVTWIQTIQTIDIPEGVTQVTGLDDSVLLRDRLAYPTPSTADVTLQTSAYDIRTGAAETVIKQYVNYNMGSLAPTARKITKLDTETDYGRGATVKGSARFDILYELLQQMADASLQGGTALGFEIVQVGTRLQFGVYAPVDRSKTVRLDIFNNRVTETTYSLGQPKTTRAIVGGQGDAAARTFLERSSTTSLAAETAWGRRIETFVDSRDTADSTALATAGDAVLGTDGKSQITANVKPTDDSTMLFGQDWYLGDTVTVVVGSYELSAVVTEMGISVQEDGVRLYGTVGEPKTNTYERQILAVQEQLTSRLNNLEKYK
jgi:hypothetical protein